jgi:hypothetical protein
MPDDAQIEAGALALYLVTRGGRGGLTPARRRDETENYRTLPDDSKLTWRLGATAVLVAAEELE